jgi:hypothetical protein
MTTTAQSFRNKKKTPPPLLMRADSMTSSSDRGRPAVWATPAPAVARAGGRCDWSGAQCFSPVKAQAPFSAGSLPIILARVCADQAVRLGENDVLRAVTLPSLHFTNAATAPACTAGPAAAPKNTVPRHFPRPRPSSWRALPSSPPGAHDTSARAVSAGAGELLLRRGCCAAGAGLAGLAARKACAALGGTGFAPGTDQVAGPAAARSVELPGLGLGRAAREAARHGVGLPRLGRGRRVDRERQRLRRRRDGPRRVGRSCSRGREGRGVSD